MSSFHPITLTLPSAAIYNAGGTGKYNLSTVTYGGLQEYIKLSPFTKNAKTKTASGSIQLYQESAIIAPSLVPEFVRVILTIEASPMANPVNIDNALVRLSELVNPTFLQRYMNGSV